MRKWHSLPLAASAITIVVAQTGITLDSLQKGEAEEFTELCFTTTPPRTGSSSAQVLAVDKVTGKWLIRVNGKLHRLKTVRESSSAKVRRDATIGDSFEEECSDGKLKAVLKYRITAIGDEATLYEGDITITLGASSNTFHIFGSEGC